MNLQNQTDVLKMVLTGATGMLGRSVDACFSKAHVDLVRLCHRRLREGFVSLDLSQAQEVNTFLNSVQPDVIVHTAAIRRPEEFAASPQKAHQLNVDSTRTLAEWTQRHPRTTLVYISSDYVFDGTHAPYEPADLPHALNAYGASKLEGERLIQTILPEAQFCIVRVPVLYGRVETLDESSVTSVLKQVAQLKNDSHELMLDHWAIRYPTWTDDVAQALEYLVRHHKQGLFHFSSNERYTKYEMGCEIAQQLGIAPQRLRASLAPANGSEPRPKDAHLICSPELLSIQCRCFDFPSAVKALIAQFKLDQ